MTTLAIQLEEPAQKILSEHAAQQHTSVEEYARSILLDHIAHYNTETIEAMEDVLAGRNLSGPYHSISELMEELHA